MTEQEEETAIEAFEYTTLVRINPGESTLPIDTVAEWFKGFELVNQIIFLLGKATYTEKWTDETGEKRESPKVHPLLLPFIQERRKLQDQIWKIGGGEALMEGKKEFFKKQADMIFQMSQDQEFKLKYKDKVQKIIEAEIFEE